jgi:hypothetical protein
VKFTPVIAKRISLGYPPGVQLGWNAFYYLTGLLFIFSDGWLKKESIGLTKMLEGVD